jgi:hypothetical protein
VLHDGSVPAVAPAELRRVRAAHLAVRGWADAGSVERAFAERERTLASFARGGRYVLWFEADLYDQLLLLQVLDALGRHGVEPARVALVSVGEFRGIAHFAGMGPTAEQLAPLAGEGTPLTDEATELAVAAWAALRSPDPTALPGISRAQSPVLRFLGEAFGRLLQEYPSRTDGLSLTRGYQVADFRAADRESRALGRAASDRRGQEAAHRDVRRAGPGRRARGLVAAARR